MTKARFAYSLTILTVLASTVALFAGRVSFSRASLFALQMGAPSVPSAGSESPPQPQAFPEPQPEPQSATTPTTTSIDQSGSPSATSGIGSTQTFTPSATTTSFSVQMLVNGQIPSAVAVPYFGTVMLSFTSNDQDRITSCFLGYRDSTFTYGGLPPNTTLQSVTSNIPYLYSCTGPGGQKAEGRGTIAVQVNTATKLTVRLTIDGSDYQVVIPYDPNRTKASVANVQAAWTSNHADAQCFATGGNGGSDGWFGSQPASGAKSVKITGYGYTYKYQVHCKWQDQDVWSNAVSVTIMDPPPTTYQVHLQANNQEGTVTIAPGVNVPLSWTSNYNANSGTVCDATGNWSGRKDFNGKELTGPLYTDSRYAIKCHNVNAPMIDSSDMVTIHVSENAPSPSPQWQPIPTVVTPSTKPAVTPAPAPPLTFPAKPEITTAPAPTSKPRSIIPTAGFEDEVKTNFDPKSNPFSDTDIASLEGRAAAELYRRDVIGGFIDGEFKGERDVNRAEAAKFLLLARFGTVADTPNKGQFRDVLDDQWYTKFVVTAGNKGIIGGYKDGTFRPANTVNTAEFLKMLALTFSLPLHLPHSYKDVSPQDWFAPYAGIAHRYNLFPGRNDTLTPGLSLSRNAVAVAIYQYLSDR